MEDMELESVENQEVAEPETPIEDETHDKDAYFADMRRKQQLDRMREENEKIRRQLENRDFEGEISKLNEDLNFYKNKEIQRIMDSDLRDIQSIEPEIDNLDELPPQFFALRFNEFSPMSAKEALIALRNIERRSRQPKPISTGSVGTVGTVENEFYTSSELDKLTSKQLNDPRTYEKAMKSMARLK